MSWPEPQPGLVIRYSYLWSKEARAGREEGSKDRPCAIVLVVSGKRVIVLPITHTPPPSPGDGIEIPLAVKVRLGLDQARAWVIASEGNDFIWPGPDLRPLPGKAKTSVTYGLLPPRLFEAIQQLFLARAASGRAGVSRRSE